MFQDGAWNLVIHDMVIFDDTFIDDNICSGLTVESEHRQRLHEFILGERRVSLNRTLQEAVAKIEEHNRLLRVKSDAIPIIDRGGLSVDNFCALPVIADVDEAIREAERSLAAAKEQNNIRTTLEFDPISLPPIDIGSLTSLLSRSLPDLDTAAAKKVQDHISRIGDDAEGWVASGIERIPDGIEEVSGKPCPFCTQNLGNSSIIEHYRSYFGEAYTSLKQEVTDAIEDLNSQHGGEAPAEFERRFRLLSERREFWSRFTDIPVLGLDTATITPDWTAARDAAIAVLSQKQNAPLENVLLPEETLAAFARYEAARARVSELSKLLQQKNSAIRIVKERAAAGNLVVLEADVIRLKATKARHSPAIVPLCNAYLSEKAAKAVSEERREAARTALDHYRLTIFPTFESSINEYLRKFNAGFRLGQFTSQNIRGGSACTYNVLINSHPVSVSGSTPTPGEPSFKTSLSAGDRNALALAFFFASLDQDANLGKKIVVIDDPISSLDEHRSLTTVQEVRRLVDRTDQVIVLSHNKPFLCNIWDGTDISLRGAIELVRDGEATTFRAWDVNRDLVTEHDRRHEILRKYLITSSHNNREVAQALRPVIEAFLRVAYPEQFPPGTLLGQFRNICGQRVGTPQEILGQKDINELCDLTEYANRFHHDTNPAYLTQP
ncbi:MAG: AAA family ATPase [Nitrospiria bacterium]